MKNEYFTERNNKFKISIGDDLIIKRHGNILTSMHVTKKEGKTIITIKEKSLLEIFASLFKFSNYCSLPEKEVKEAQA